MSTTKRPRGRTQRAILEALEAAGGAIVPTRTLARDIYGKSDEPQILRVRSIVCALKKGCPDLDIVGFNGGYQLRVTGRRVNLSGMEFPAMLTALRERDGLTIAALAELSGVGSSYISLIENGGRTLTRRSADLLIRAFRLNTEDRDRFLIAAGFWPWKIRPAAVEQIIGAVRRRPPQERAS